MVFSCQRSKLAKKPGRHTWATTVSVHNFLFNLFIYLQINGFNGLMPSPDMYFLHIKVVNF